MRWNAKRHADYGEWKEWFAWYPVRIMDKWVWLENVSRKRISWQYSDWLYVKVN